MAAELHRRKEQLKQRLSRHLSASQESLLHIPPVSALRNVLKTGPLQKLSSRGRLSPRCWKKRLCVLTKTALYIYKTEGDSGASSPAGHIDLTVFCNCKEMTPKETKKTTNAFMLCRSDAAAHVTRHVFAARSATELADWLRAIRTVTEQSVQAPTPQPIPPQALSDSEASASVRTSTAVDPASVPLPADGSRRPRGRARQRPRPAVRPGPSDALQQSVCPLAELPPSAGASSQPCLLDWPARGSGSSRSAGGGGLSSAYEYSSSGESVSSLGSSRCSVVRRLNTTMPEITLSRRSPSPAAVIATTSAADVRQQMVVGADGFPALVAPGHRRGSLPSIVASLQTREKDAGLLSVGGTASTGSSSISNLTATLTREGQSLPAVLSGLAELRDGLRQVTSRVDSVEKALAGSDAEMATARADVAAVQGSLASLQSLVTTLNNKISLFSGMFHKVDVQLQEMWAEMETVNNNVHHVMHTALESQARNEQLFAQLAGLRSQLLTSFPDQLTCGGSLPRPARRRHAEPRRRRDRLDSELLCEIDDPALDEVAPPAAVVVEKVAPLSIDSEAEAESAVEKGAEEGDAGRSTPVGGGPTP